MAAVDDDADDGVVDMVDDEVGGTASTSNAAVASDKDYQAPWVERYRPTNIADVVGNEETVARLQMICRDGNMPHLIIAGPPGTGKTTSIMCLAKALLGDMYKDGVYELNASDDRGIDVVRDRIKMFAQKKVTLPAGRHKIIILDEADSMTQGAQQALRRTMEKYANTTRFALACNMSTKIIEPIQSRCVMLRYTRLSDQQVLSRLLDVVRAEKVPYVESGLESILFTADGDMRQAINALQATYTGFGFVDEANVFKVCDQPHPKTVKEMVHATLESKLELACSLMQSLLREGYAVTDVLGTLFRVVKSFEAPMSEYTKLEYIRIIGIFHVRVADGLTTELQLLGLIAQLCDVAGKY